MRKPLFHYDLDVMFCVLSRPRLQKLPLKSKYQVENSEECAIAIEKGSTSTVNKSSTKLYIISFMSHLVSFLWHQISFNDSLVQILPEDMLSRCFCIQINPIMRCYGLIKANNANKGGTPFFFFLTCYLLLTGTHMRCCVPAPNPNLGGEWN